MLAFNSFCLKRLVLEELVLVYMTIIAYLKFVVVKTITDRKRLLPNLLILVVAGLLTVFETEPQYLAVLRRDREKLVTE